MKDKEVCCCLIILLKLSTITKSKNEKKILQSGVGKSFLINAWRNLVGEGGSIYCKVATPTGRSSYLVQGETLHSLLFLPVFQHFKPLQGAQLTRLQQRFSKCKLLIIDEYSQVGTKIFGWIDERLRQATGKLHLPFGGLSICLVGDMLQLPPVLDRPLWNDSRDNLKDHQLNGLLMYGLFEKVIMLKEQMRQNPEEKVLQDLIDHLRAGTCTAADWKVCNSRMTDQLNEVDRERSENALYVIYNNKDVDDYNDAKLAELNEPIFRINSRHTGEGSKVASTSTMGLAPYLRICKNARVMIRCNLWKDKGIVNGTMGYIRDIIYKKGVTPPGLPICVVVELDAPYSGPHLPGKPRHVPICTITNIGVGSQGPIERTQLPLCLVWAISIYKVQGMTLSSCRVNLGKSEATYGATNVAVSRTRRLRDLFFEPFDLDRITTAIHKPPLLKAFMERSEKQFLAAKNSN